MFYILLVAASQVVNFRKTFFRYFRRIVVETARQVKFFHQHSIVFFCYSIKMAILSNPSSLFQMNRISWIVGKARDLSSSYFVMCQWIFCCAFCPMKNTFSKRLERFIANQNHRIFSTAGRKPHSSRLLFFSDVWFCYAVQSTQLDEEKSTGSTKLRSWWIRLLRFG